MDIKELRTEIQKIDEQMAALFERRMEAARGVAEYKREHGLAVEDLDQEQRVIESRSGLIEDTELRSYYIQFLHDTMDVSKRWQHHLLDGQRIAVCPVRDDTAFEAAGKLFPDGTLIEFGSYEEAYNAAESGDCDLAVLPFEVSYAGEVGRVLDLMYAGSLHVNDVYEHKAESETTRYAVLSRVENPSAADGIGSAFMIMFTVKDETGGLAKAINIISAYNYNMRIMRSRPMQDLPWHYYFYAEAIGDDTSENGKRMINALSAACPTVKIVGRYKI